MEPTLNPGSGFLRFRVDFTYDGTNFNGWARQPNLRTVQSSMEEAITGLTRSEVELVVAGRTDAGVHATAQVAHFVIFPSEINMERSGAARISSIA
ncbi:MAG: hypothetical protein RLZZ35_550 [Actinomycetota bacterium]